MRKIKVLGLMLVAVFAMSAVAATAASADDFTAESYPTTLTGVHDPGTADDLFQTTAGPVTCKNPTYHGVISGPTTTLTVTPTYHECTAFGFPAVIDSADCHYKFIIGTGTTGSVELDATGKSCTVTAISAGTTKCIVHVESQKVGGTVTYSQTGSGATREGTIKAELTGIKYTHTKGTGLGACTAGSAENGTLTAFGTVTGEKEVSAGKFEHVGLFLS